jgi:hypothetical protein
MSELKLRPLESTMPKERPQRLKPACLSGISGTAEAVPSRKRGLYSGLARGIQELQEGADALRPG